MAAVAPDSCNLAVLDDVHASGVGRAGEAPGDGVVADHGRTRLVYGADDRQAHVRGGIEDRHTASDLREVHHAVFHAVHAHGARHLQGDAFHRGTLDEGDHASSADHQV